MRTRTNMSHRCFSGWTGNHTPARESFHLSSATYVAAISASTLFLSADIAGLAALRRVSRRVSGAGASRFLSFTQLCTDLPMAPKTAMPRVKTGTRLMQPSS